MTDKLQDKLNTKYFTRQEALSEWCNDIVRIREYDSYGSKICEYELRQFSELIEKEPIYPYRTQEDFFKHRTYFQYIKK